MLLVRFLDGIKVESKSTHKAEVVHVKLEKHPDADSLSICPVWGYSYVARTEDWQGVSLGVYFQPDSMVDTRRPEFAFLAKDAKYDQDCNTTGPYARIRAKRLRGVVSYGLMIPAPPGVKEGDDLAEFYGMLRYEPPTVGSSGKQKGPRFVSTDEIDGGPSLYSPKYDVDSFQRWAHKLFQDGELVICTEKIHGQNARFVYSDGRFHCGSRTEWKKEFPTTTVDEVGLKTEVGEERANLIIEGIKKREGSRNTWWVALDNHPELKEWLQNHPDHIVYGEVYGKVQKGYNYGSPGDLRVYVFDILKGTDWLDPLVARNLATDLPWVPIVAEMSYKFDEVIKLAEGNTLSQGQHIREGVVISCIKERSDPKYGRAKLKVINPDFK
jgi:RNA ligase (TIGR02306 family)